MSVRTSLDPPAKYGPVLQAALNDHTMADSMAPSGEAAWPALPDDGAAVGLPWLSC